MAEPGLGAGAALAAAPLYGDVDMYKLAEDALPPGWVLEKELRASADGLARFEKIYGVRPREILNQIWRRGDALAQVNYMLFASEEEAEKAELKLLALIGDVNVLHRDANLVVEILSKDAWMKQVLCASIVRSAIFDVALNAEDVPQGWMLAQFLTAADAKISFFEEKLGGKIAFIVNQVFAVPQGSGTAYVKVNYLECESDEDTARVFQTIKSISGPDAVLQRGNVVIEVVTREKLLRNQAVESLRMVAQ
ncbi:hypothetical protein [Deferrisoma sp.]